MSESPDFELHHPFSRAARWSSRVGTRLAWLSLWLVAVASPALAFIALGVWPWALPLLALTIVAAIYGRRGLQWIEGPSREGQQQVASPPEATGAEPGPSTVFAYVLGVAAWLVPVIVLTQVGRRLGPPSRDLLVWLHTWQWWLTAAAVAGVACVGLLAYSAQRASRNSASVLPRSGVGLAVSAGVIGLLVLCLGVGYSRGIGKLRWGICYKNLLNVNLALQMYLADHDDVFPPAESWTDLMYPYVKNLDVFLCPEAPQASCGLALNAALAGQRITFGEPTRHVITLLESDRGWNAAGGREALPEVPRHGNGDNYGLLLGSCTWAARRELGRDDRGIAIYDTDTASGWPDWDIASALEGWPPEERVKYGLPEQEPEE